MVAPVRAALAATSSTTAISMSVAVRVSPASVTSMRTLARIGMVLRFSATLWIWASALISVARSALNFIVSRSCWRPAWHLG